LARAQTLARESGEPIDSVCTRLGLCTERDLVQAIATSLRIEAVGPKDLLAKPAIADSINPRFLLTSRALPLSADDDHMVVAMVDPTDEDAIRGLEFAAERRVDRRVCSATDFEAAWQRLYGAGADAGQDTADHQSNADDVERLQDFASDAPVIRTVNQIVARAIDMLASDIHIEPNGQEYRVRFRLDGMLAEIEGHPAAFGMSVVSRIKIMARLNIAERRLAQDGRFSVSARGQKVDLRVATTPTVHGEAVVLRILDSERVPLDTRALGFSPVLEARWTQLLDRPHGIVLVTGPTGSGKSTTLYAGLTRLNQPDRKLLTIEDPVEQQIDGVNQVHARPEIGFGFGAALRAFLRHDPDVIMVGEIRDLETARTAIQAALTGHLILSTLHTNDAVSGITRLLDMGIDAYLIASTVNGILAQRLVRTICPGCRAHATAAAGSAIICQLCGGSGYKGRTTIGELLLMTPEMRSLVERLDSFELLLDA
jgi:general secretion pathway protein E